MRTTHSCSAAISKGRSWPARAAAPTTRTVCAPPTPTAVELLLTAAAGTLGQITLAPELPGALAAIDRFVDAGVASPSAIPRRRTSRLGPPSMPAPAILTHAFNAMPGIHHRAPGPVMAAVDSAGVCLELINDGEHVAAPGRSTRCSTLAPQRVAFVSDAMAAAGGGDGDYVLGGPRGHGVAAASPGSATPTRWLARPSPWTPRCAEPSTHGIAPEVAVGALTLAPATALGIQAQVRPPGPRVCRRLRHPRPGGLGAESVRRRRRDRTHPVSAACRSTVSIHPDRGTETPSRARAALRKKLTKSPLGRKFLLLTPSGDSTFTPRPRIALSRGATPCASLCHCQQPSF